MRLLCVILPLAACAPALAAPPRSDLARFHAEKYSAGVLGLVESCVNGVFIEASDEERRQAVAEVLACFHIVFHETRSHRIDSNVAVIRAHSDEIAIACERFGVPQPMATAILAWENSGQTAATSYAACVGLGQLSDGAVAQAHRVSGRYARVEFAAASFCRTLADLVDLCGPHHPLAALIRGRAAFLDKRARELDLASVHETLRRAAHVKDERAVPRANIEDSVVYMRYLLAMYPGCPDLAISTYHNGVANTDDLLIDFLRRHAPRPGGYSRHDRGPIVDGLKRLRLSYVTLWNDRRSREMLNGLRTMDGDVTTAANAREAMGDESDLYVWKTLGALAATRASSEALAELCARYRPEQGEAETRGFVPRSQLVTRRGFAATAQLHAWLDALERRWRSASASQRSGKPAPARPHRRGVLEISHGHDSDAHRAGLAVDLVVSDALLAGLLDVDWRFDRIYKRRLPNGAMHVVINPRFADEVLVRESSASSSAAPRSPQAPSSSPSASPKVEVLPEAPGLPHRQDEWH